MLDAFLTIFPLFNIKSLTDPKSFFILEMSAQNILPCEQVYRKLKMNEKLDWQEPMEIFTG